MHFGCSEQHTHLENQEMKLVDIKLLKGVIEELGIEDKIIINDDYIKFLLDDPCKNIIKILIYRIDH